MQFLLVQNRQQTHDWTLIGSGANGLGIQEWEEKRAHKAVTAMPHKFGMIWSTEARNELVNAIN